MLSDSLFEVCQQIWRAKDDYEYSEDHKKEMINALTELNFVIYKLDRIKEDCTLSKEDIRSIVTKQWLTSHSN